MYGGVGGGPNGYLSKIITNNLYQRNFINYELFEYFLAFLIPRHSVLMLRFERLIRFERLKRLKRLKRPKRPKRLKRLKSNDEIPVS